MSHHYSLTLKEALQLSSKERADLLSCVTDRSKELNSKLNAFLRFDPAAQEAGIPIALKDNICVRGKEITCGSKILKGHVPPYDATVTEKLKKAGASIFAHCNMDEFAFGSSSETSAYGPVRNPWDLERVPGGSSGGSAACVAADMAVAALGSDTGGSIRQPAGFCGVVGLKPT